MRKFKLMPLVLLASVFGLSACTLPKWLSFLSFIPGLEAPEEEKEEKKEKEEEEEEQETTYTVEEVVEAINNAFASVLQGGTLLEYDSEDDVYIGVLNFSEDGEDYSNTQAEESVLYPVVYTLMYYMPEFLGEAEYHYWTSEEDFWEDESGDTVSEAFYEVPGNVGVDLISYCYNGYLIGQVQVFELSE